MNTRLPASAPVSNSRLLAALLLHALPVPGAIFLLSMESCSSLGSDDLWCWSLVAGWYPQQPTHNASALLHPELILWLALAVVLSQALWGLGYLLLPEADRTFVKVFGLGIVINSVALVIAMMLFAIVFSSSAMYLPPGGPSAEAISYIRQATMWQAIEWNVWAVINLLAVAVMCWHTWRLARGGTGAARDQATTTA